jgi:hypothetical protein
VFCPYKDYKESRQEFALLTAEKIATREGGRFMSKDYQDLTPQGKKKVSRRFVASPQMDLFPSSFQLQLCNENINCMDCRQCVPADFQKGGVK